MKFWQTAPILLPAIRAGELDGRFINFTADLGAAGDWIADLRNVNVIVSRRDGFPITDGVDLHVAGPTSWPNTLDPTGLILTIGLQAPGACAGVGYILTVVVSTTAAGRIFVRDATIDVLAHMG